MSGHLVVLCSTYIFLLNENIIKNWLDCLHPYLRLSQSLFVFLYFLCG